MPAQPVPARDAAPLALAPPPARCPRRQTPPRGATPRRPSLPPSSRPRPSSRASPNRLSRAATAQPRDPAAWEPLSRRRRGTCLACAPPAFIVDGLQPAPVEPGSPFVNTTTTHNLAACAPSAQAGRARCGRRRRRRAGPDPPTHAVGSPGRS
jgi:hypothetical protein